MWYVGIDIAKEKFDVAVLNEQQEITFGQFKNTLAGYKALQKWLKKKHKKEPAHVVMEATNIYWEEVAEYLCAQGYDVSVVNPAVIKGFAQSMLSRNKTDKQDSKLIALYGQERQPKLWSPPAPHQRQLRALVRHREALKKTRTQQKNRLAMTRDEAVRASLEALIAVLDEQIQNSQDKIAILIEEHEDLRGDGGLLHSIPGIGPETLSLLLAEFYDLRAYKSAASFAADAGVTSSRHESGTSVRRRIKMSRVGKSSVRGGLFQPVRAAMRFNPLVRALAERLAKRGKHYMTIVVACMRKLLHIVFGVIKNQTPFDPDIMSTKNQVLT